MNYPKIKDLPLNEKTTTVVLLMSIEEKETKSMKSYCRLLLSDGESQVEANLWNHTKADVKVKEKSLITAQLYPKMYQESVSFELFTYGPAPEECKIEDYVLKVPYDSEAMYEEILQLLRKEVPKTNPFTYDLVDMVTAIYSEHKEKLLYWSAAKAIHHNCYGGLLYHTFRMVRTGIVLSRVYKDIDKELLLAGIALHDIGKLLELDTDSLGIADYSINGVLFGHSMLGIEIVTEEELRQVELAKHEDNGSFYSPEKVRLLKHMLASHHGQLDWGAVALPVIPEAMLLHEIDMIDSRMYQYENTLSKLEPGEMSDRIFGLGSRVYKENKENHL